MGESGFTLIELLTVIIIIGILSAIAIPVYLHQRDAARRGTMVADLRETAVLFETYFTDYDVYPSTVSSLGTGLRTSPDNSLQIVSSGSGAFCISVTNARLGTTRYWQSDAGGLLPFGTVCT